MKNLILKLSFLLFISISFAQTTTTTVGSLKINNALNTNNTSDEILVKNATTKLVEKVAKSQLFTDYNIAFPPITQYISTSFLDNNLGTRLIPIGTTYNGFHINKSINGNVGFSAFNTDDTGNSAVSSFSAKGSGGLYSNVASLNYVNNNYYVPFLRNSALLYSDKPWFVMSTNNNSIDFHTGAVYGSTTSKLKINGNGQINIGTLPALDNSVDTILGRNNTGDLVSLDKSTIIGATSDLDAVVTAGNSVFDKTISLTSLSFNSPKIDLEQNGIFAYDNANSPLNLFGFQSDGFKYINSGFFTNIFNTPSSQNNNIFFPNASGTVALLSDIGAGSSTNITYTQSLRQINSSTGTGAVLPLVTITDAGLLSSTDKVKIDAITGTNTGDNAINTNYVNDYRSANFIPGTDYALPNSNTTGTASNITGNLPQSQVVNLTTDLLLKQDKPTVLKLAANFPNATVTRNNVTGMNFPIVAGKEYKVELIGHYQTTAVATGGSIGFVLTSGVGTIKGSVKMAISQATVSTDLSTTIRAINATNTTGGSFITSTGVSVINSPHSFSAILLFDCTTSGVFQLQFASETTSQAQMNLGTKMIVTTLN